ncbi:ABC transporter ATP-binding protein [Cohnella nanjingensis]|uniref:ABC transporter ATP-binding protein n=1 Tax=Cohnella nanjingensis TaxID=1387779 RepID=A0A7X0RP19_9BACL|nr:ABC transporter ATP-binding protein [Cohnella nanjingensis]MBB6670911.1 ABC transporter ATP-binding protein [Cohnella nanjingensis]
MGNIGNVENRAASAGKAPAISCREVGMTLKKKKVLANVTFEVEAGSLTGLLGPNGAGKSTLMRILTGLVPPETGRADLFGAPAGPERLGVLSFLPDRGQLPPYLTAGEWLQFAASLYPDWSKTAERDLAEELGVDRAQRIGAMSRGEEARLQLLTCLSRQAPLIVLDEPFTGVDLVSRERIASAVVGEMADGERTFLIATHDIREMEQLFDRIVLVGKGTIQGSYLVDDLRRSGRSVESCYREVFA